MKNDINDALRKILNDMEEELYFGGPKHTMGVRRILKKLGIKSANEWRVGGLPLQVESLEATLSKVTFDDEVLKKWKP